MSLIKRHRQMYIPDGTAFVHLRKDIYVFYLTQSLAYCPFFVCIGSYSFELDIHPLGLVISSISHSSGHLLQSSTHGSR